MKYQLQCNSYIIPFRTKHDFLLGISIVLLFLPTILFSQSYIPFPQSNAVWNVTWTDQGCFISGLPDGKYSYFIGNDTLINSTNYHKLYRSGLCFPCCTPPIGIDIDGYAGAYRNDSVNKSVYWIAFGMSSEVKLYDFNLSVADTIQGYIASICSDPVVTTIDSVYLGGIYRKRYGFTGTICYGYLIEGIGSSLGLIEPLKTFDGGGELNCMSVNQTTIYPDSSSSCALITEISKGIDKEDAINIERLESHIIVQYESDFKFDENFKISVFDLLGRNLFSSTLKEHTITLDLEQKMVYIFHIINGKEYYQYTVH